MALLEHYGLIGDSTTIALVSNRGSIDWMCLPRIDSSACFARLLGNDRNGYWTLRPTAQVLSVRQRYRPDTLVLETEMECATGRVRLIDFMPPGAQEHDLVRIVEGVEGQVPMHGDLRARFDYGRLVPWIRANGQRATLTSGPSALALTSPVPLSPDWENARIEVNFTVKARQRYPFTLAAYDSHEEAPSGPIDAEKELQNAERHWQTWASRCHYQGPYREAVVRSLITLKALTYEPTGGIVAAATTSLPEEIGGVRNWDYRYCWLRDASLTLDALMRAGYNDEARGWRDWLMRATAGAPGEMQIMYGVAGEHRLTEQELPWLPGYEESRPVRIGNGAYSQFQLDVYGEMLHTLYEARVHGVVQDLPVGWDFLTVVVDFVEKSWQRTDEGIWEIRSNKKHHFTHSKLMAWVAVDRAVRFIEEFGKGAPPKMEGRLHRWRALREEIRGDLLTRGFNPHVGAFTQSYDSEALDASLLLVPHMGFLPADDPRVLGTVAAIEKGLTKEGFVYRYATETGVDGLAGDEATFLICSFWLVDNYSMTGRFGEAQQLLEKLLSIRNELGLLAEEYHPGLRRQIGNFPQAFSHVGLINSAYLLEAQRSGKKPTFPAVLAETLH
jgi:GH15 family glucan-1,4-alpha-glucosidase